MNNYNLKSIKILFLGWASGIAFDFLKLAANDKVMQIKNNYEKNVFNGDIGNIININIEDKNLTITCDICNNDYNTTFQLFEIRLNNNQIPCLNCKPYKSSLPEIEIEEQKEEVKETKPEKEKKSEEKLSTKEEDKKEEGNLILDEAVQILIESLNSQK
jgi:hypothetical protein